MAVYPLPYSRALRLQLNFQGHAGRYKITDIPSYNDCAMAQSQCCDHQISTAMADLRREPSPDARILSLKNKQPFRK
jgi:hypothetical protein